LFVTLQPYVTGVTRVLSDLNAGAYLQSAYGQSV
jgi:hypothetical protein